MLLPVSLKPAELSLPDPIMTDGVGIYNSDYSSGERKKPLGNFWRYSIGFFLFLNFVSVNISCSQTTDHTL